MATAAKDLVPKSVYLRVRPRMTQLRQSQEVLRKLQSFGEVQFFRSMRYDPGQTHNNSILAIFEDKTARDRAIAAKSFSVEVISDEVTDPPTDKSLAIGTALKTQWSARTPPEPGAAEMLVPDLDFIKEIEKLGAETIDAPVKHKHREAAPLDIPLPIPDPVLTPHLFKPRAPLKTYTIAIDEARADHLAIATSSLARQLEENFVSPAPWRVQMKRLLEPKKMDFSPAALYRDTLQAKEDSTGDDATSEAEKRWDSGFDTALERDDADDREEPGRRS
jgi:hypothetical protein